jgi:hypothetical protein
VGTSMAMANTAAMRQPLISAPLQSFGGAQARSGRFGRQGAKNFDPPHGACALCSPTSLSNEAI